jgi:hypothetical protein
VAQHPYKISSVSIQPFSSYEIGTDGHQLERWQIRLIYVRLGYIELMTRMRRRSCAKASLLTLSLIHLTTLKFRQDRFTKCKYLETSSLDKLCVA